MNKIKIRYSNGDQALLDQIKLLWEELNEHHCQHSPNFKEHYNQMTFEKRKSDLLKKSLSGEMGLTCQSMKRQDALLDTA